VQTWQTCEITQDLATPTADAPEGTGACNGGTDFLYQSLSL
jgi:hypothetical protein